MGDGLFDDATTEVLLRGEAPSPDADVVAVASFVRDLRASASLPPPPPSAALAALLRDGAVPARQPFAPPATPRRAGMVLRGWRRWVAVAGIGTGALMTSVVGAGAAGLLPGPAERVIGDVVQTLTPLTLPEQAHGPRPRPSTAPGSRTATPPTGQVTSSVATMTASSTTLVPGTQAPTTQAPAGATTPSVPVPPVLGPTTSAPSTSTPTLPPITLPPLPW
jgi:hypothetical protein